MGHGGETLSGPVTWQIQTDFNWLIAKDTERVETRLTPPTPATVDASTAWTAPFGASPFGGTAEVHWTYQGKEGYSSFYICGENPSGNDADSALNATGYWFAKKISLHETNEAQFCNPYGRMDRNTA